MKVVLTQYVHIYIYILFLLNSLERSIGFIFMNAL
jgi:hypothetical protein